MTQTQSILLHLKRERGITPLEALRRYGCFRLAARIAELRAAGHDILTQRVEVRGGKNVARYRLIRAA